MSLWACPVHGLYGGSVFCPACGDAGTFEQMIPDEEGWSEWIHPLPGYLMACCDCGLVHELQVAITESHDAVSVTNEGEDIGHVVVFRMRRPASVDGRRMAETGTGSVRSTTSAVPRVDEADAQKAPS